MVARTDGGVGPRHLFRSWGRRAIAVGAEAHQPVAMH